MNPINDTQTVKKNYPIRGTILQNVDVNKPQEIKEKKHP